MTTGQLTAPARYGEVQLGAWRKTLADREVGHVVIRGAVELGLVERYRAECEAFLANGPVLHRRITRADMFDYVHPRHIGADGKPARVAEPSTFRIYQFPWNATPVSRPVFDALLGVRDAIEQCWLEDPVYGGEMKEVVDYVQPTRFVPGRGGLPRHKDYAGPPTYPFLQVFMFLSQPGRDFDGGELTLFTRDGGRVRLIEDLGLQPGDIVLFDRDIEHEVQPTKAGADGDVGRWSVVVSRDRPAGSYWDRYRYADWYLHRVQPWVDRVRRRLH